MLNNRFQSNAINSFSNITSTIISLDNYVGYRNTTVGLCIICSINFRIYNSRNFDVIFLIWKFISLFEIKRASGNNWNSFHLEPTFDALSLVFLRLEQNELCFRSERRKMRQQALPSKVNVWIDDSKSVFASSRWFLRDQ